MRQARIHAEGHVCGRHHFSPGDVDDMRQALPAHRRIGRQERPAIFYQLLIGIREAVRRLHAGIVTAHTALLVTDGV